MDEKTGLQNDLVNCLVSGKKVRIRWGGRYGLQTEGVIIMMRRNDLTLFSANAKFDPFTDIKYENLLSVQVL